MSTTPHNPTETMPRGNRRRFIAWLRTYGVSKLARELHTNRTTVYVWVRGQDGRCVAPSTSFMTRMVDLSTTQPFEYGPITYEDMLAETEGFRGQRGSSYRGTVPAVAARTAVR